jgi:hypothetical protein
LLVLNVKRKDTKLHLIVKRRKATGSGFVGVIFGNGLETFLAGRAV